MASDFLTQDGRVKIRILIHCRAVERKICHAWLCNWPGHRASNWTGNSFPGWAQLKPAVEPDVWTPNSRVGHFQLFYFAAFISIVGVGGNIAIRHLWASLNIAFNIF